jgi:hypothetical protein
MDLDPSATPLKPGTFLFSDSSTQNQHERAFIAALKEHNEIAINRKHA